MVSQARMSTRVTLTTLRPYPWATDRSGKSVEMSGARRAPAATRASPAATTPTVTPIARRAHRLRRSGRAENRLGRRRSTSTKTAMVAVSTRNCVSARSGAPCRTNSMALP